ncbi:MAG TPA: HNH endonuclease [Candidatus Saccharimonadales bacterium]|nr:HNH endonuclease [Candidatus Saccharimonadales bacterium]
MLVETGYAQLGPIGVEAGAHARQAAPLPLAPEKTLGTSRVFSLEDFLHLEVENKLYSPINEFLRPVSEELVFYNFWLNSDSPLGRLAGRATISTTTGCWSVLKGRTPMGYVKVYGEHNYGLPKKQGRDNGIMSHKLAYILLQQELGFEPVVPEGKQLDHICRNTACCNPNHLQPLSDRRNKQLMAIAHKLENKLREGQTMIVPSGLIALDEPLSTSTMEDTGVIVVGRFGPYRMIKIDENTVVGTREPCEIFDNLQAPPPNKYVDKSRAKKHKPMDGEERMFEDAAAFNAQVKDNLLAASA